SRAGVVPSVDLVSSAGMGPRSLRRLNVSRDIQCARTRQIVAWDLERLVEDAARGGAVRAPVCARPGIALGVQLVTGALCSRNDRAVRARASRTRCTRDPR